jgi:hypothetical protein
MCGETLAIARKDMREAIEKAVAAVREECKATIAVSEARHRSVAGRLPPVRTGSSEGDVLYEGEIASVRGSSYQALRDAETRPGDPAAWVCVSRGGSPLTVP